VERYLLFDSNTSQIKLEAYHSNSYFQILSNYLQFLTIKPRGKKMKTNIIVGLFLLGFLTYGCGASVQTLVAPKQETPIDVSKLNLPAIGMGKIESGLTPGQKIGAHFTGWANIKRQDYYAEGSISEEWQEKYEDIVIEELSNAGYKTKQKSNLFEIDDSFNARFLVVEQSVIQQFRALVPIHPNIRNL